MGGSVPRDFQGKGRIDEDRFIEPAGTQRRMILFVGLALYEMDSSLTRTSLVVRS